MEKSKSDFSYTFASITSQNKSDRDYYLLWQQRMYFEESFRKQLRNNKTAKANLV